VTIVIVGAQHADKASIRVGEPPQKEFIYIYYEQLGVFATNAEEERQHLQYPFGE